MTITEMVAVMLAAENGAKIQVCVKWQPEQWLDLPEDLLPAWDWSRCEYRVAKFPQEKVVTNRVTKTAPEVIYLQVSDDSFDCDEEFPEPTEDMTWCQDSVIACEVKYIRADLQDKPANSDEVSR
jgi:hypothetical protein